MMEVLAVGMFVRRVFEDLSQQQRVFDQATAWDVQEVPEVQFATEGRLQTALKEVVHPMVLLLMVQQCFGCYLVTAVTVVDFKTRELQPERKRRIQCVMLLLKDRCLVWLPFYSDTYEFRMMSK